MTVNDARPMAAWGGGGNVQNSYSAGNRVFQSNYGHGTVTVVNEYHTVVDFDAHGSRTFATRLVQLEPSATPAPPKAPKTRRRAKQL